MRATVTARAGGRCELTGWSPCWHPAGERLDVNEAPRAGQYAEARYIVECCMLLCRGHHDIDSTDRELSERLGIHIPLHVYHAHPAKATTQARWLRCQARRGHLGTPYWHRDSWGGVDDDRAERDAA